MIYFNEYLLLCNRREPIFSYKLIFDLVLRENKERKHFLQCRVMNVLSFLYLYNKSEDQEC